MADPIADLFFGMGESITRYGTVTRRTARAEDTAETFTRASTGLERGKDMLIRTADPDVLRTEWEDQDGDGVAETALTLLEGQATNVAPYSENVEQWTPAGGSGNQTVASDVDIAPTGYQTADRLTDPDGSLQGRRAFAVGAPDDTSYWTAQWAIMKEAGQPLTRLDLLLFGGTLTRGIFTFDRDTGALTLVGGEAVRYEATLLGRYWIVTATIQNNGTGNTEVRAEVYPASDAAGGAAGVAGACTIGFVDVKNQAFPTSYIPTTSYLIQPNQAGVWGLNWPGLAGNFAESPDSGFVAIAGDLSVTMKFATANWNPGTAYQPFKKDNGTLREWQCGISAAGFPQFDWWDAAGTLRSVIGPVAPTVTAGEVAELGVFLDVDDGAGSHAVQFYQFLNGVWQTLGAPKSAGAFVTSVRTHGAPLRIGDTGNAGFGHRFQLYNGSAWAGGTLVFDVDYTDVSTHLPDRVKIQEKANDAVVASQATSSAVTRAEDFLSVPWDYAPNVTHTGYLAFREGGATLTNGGRLFTLGGEDAPYLRITQAPGGYRVVHHNGTTSAESVVAATIPLGAWVEARYEYDGTTGEVTFALDVDRAGEVVGTPATPGDPADAWSSPTGHFGNSGAANPEYGYMRAAAAKFATGRRSQAVMRVL